MSTLFEPMKRDGFASKYGLGDGSDENSTSVSDSGNGCNERSHGNDAAKARKRRTHSVRSWLQAFVGHGLDMRSMALARFGVGCGVALEAIWLLWDIEAMLSDTGVTPRAALFHAIPPGHAGASIFLATGTVTHARCLLWTLVTAALAFAAGWGTRRSGATTWVLLSSVHARNPPIFHGGDGVARLLVLTLTLADSAGRLSVDAWWAARTQAKCELWQRRRFDGGLGGKRGKRVKLARLVGPKRSRDMTAAALLVQCMAIHFCTGWLKMGREWTTDSTAVEFALRLDIAATWLGHILLATAPRALLAVGCQFVLWTERLVPLVIAVLAWWGRGGKLERACERQRHDDRNDRTSADDMGNKRKKEERDGVSLRGNVLSCCIALMMSLQVVFGSTLRVGNFPLFATLTFVPCLPAAFWDLVGMRIGGSVGQALHRGCGQAIRMGERRQAHEMKDGGVARMMEQGCFSLSSAIGVEAIDARKRPLRCERGWRQAFDAATYVARQAVACVVLAAVVGYNFQAHIKVSDAVSKSRAMAEGPEIGVRAGDQGQSYRGIGGGLMHGTPVLGWMGEALWLEQTWDMFAPWPNTSDGWFFAALLHADGSVSDALGNDGEGVACLAAIQGDEERGESGEEFIRRNEMDEIDEVAGSDGTAPEDADQLQGTGGNREQEGRKQRLEGCLAKPAVASSMFPSTRWLQLALRVWSEGLKPRVFWPTFHVLARHLCLTQGSQNIIGGAVMGQGDSGEGADVVGVELYFVHEETEVERDPNDGNRVMRVFDSPNPSPILLWGVHCAAVDHHAVRLLDVPSWRQQGLVWG